MYTYKKGADEPALAVVVGWGFAWCLEHGSREGSNLLFYNKRLITLVFL